MKTGTGEARFSQFPMLWLSVFLAMGILLADTFAFNWRWPLAVCLVATTVAIIYRGKRFANLLVACALISAGSLLLISHQKASEKKLKTLFDSGVIESGNPIEIEGVVSGGLEPTFDGFFVRIAVDTLMVDDKERVISGSVRLFAYVADADAVNDYQALNLQNGNRIRVMCALFREDAFLNPGVRSRKSLLDQQDLDATGSIKSALLIENVTQPKYFLPMDYIYDWRNRLIRQFHERFNNATAGIMTASLLGDKYFLDKSTADIFRDGGTFHILVISGLHITFIGGVAIFIIGLFTQNKQTQYLLATLILWGYTLAVGGEIPVVRASLMFTVVAFSHLFYRSASLLNTLGTCSLLLLCWRPADLFSPSFQLTFISVSAIVVMGFPLIEKLRSIGTWFPDTPTPFPPNVSGVLRRLCETIYHRPAATEIDVKRQIWSANLHKNPYFNWPGSINIQKFVGYLIEGIIVSAVVQLWLLPLQIIYFHRISFSAIFLNLWIGIFIAIESFFALFAVFVAAINETAAIPFLRATELLNWILISVPQWLVERNLAGFRLPNYSGKSFLIYIVFLGLAVAVGYFAFNWNPFELKRAAGRTRMIIIICATTLALGVALIAHPFSSPEPDGKLHIDFLDVGQGDAALVTFPDGKTMLIDGGGRQMFDDGDDDFQPDNLRIGEAVVSAFLWETGYSQIDYVLATHADADHMQGLVDVVNNFAVGTAFVGRSPDGDVEFDEFASALNKRNVELITLERGDSMNIGGAVVDVLYPTGQLGPAEPSDNEHSLVIRVSFGATKVLFTGDIEKLAEAHLLASPEFLRANIIKVPHHGSRTSSGPAFVDAVNPQIAVISVGKRSMFGHPHKEVVERWQAVGARVLLTGKSGTISVISDGKTFEINELVERKK